MPATPAPEVLVYTHKAVDHKGVQCLAFNRPAARNALSVAMVRQLQDALRTIEADRTYASLSFILADTHSSHARVAELTCS